MKWFFKCFKQYADFKGRARRKEYWWFMLINIIIMFICIIGFIVPLAKMYFDDIAAGLDVDSFNEWELMQGIITNPFFYIYLIYSLAVLIPTYAVTVRRLHDIGKSGYWAFLYLGVSLLTSLVEVIPNTVAYGVIYLVIIAIYILFLVWMFTNSDYGPNKYGPNPKGEGNPTEESPTIVDSQF